VTDSTTTAQPADGTTRPSDRAGEHRRALRVLTLLMCVAVAVSVIHYCDNYFNYRDYPRSSTLPNPNAASILTAWLAFTAAGLAGYALFRRASSALALVLLAVYSGSGLIGIAHYVVPGATGMPWWRQAHVVLDIACGVAVLAFTLRAVRQRSRSAGL
jgi:hypothetical protein